MKRIILFFSLALSVALGSVASAQTTKKLVRVKQNADGTRTELEEIDKHTIVRTTRKEKANKERIVSSKSTYIMDGNRVLRNCKIADGQGRVLFIVRYGYDKNTGRLIAEAMFDAQAKRFNPAGEEVPVQRLYYKYDPLGNRSKPFAITSVGNKTVEKVTSWNKHIKERLKTIDANFDDSTMLTDEELKQLESE